MAALFGGLHSRSHNRNIVEFKAGKMTMDGKTVSPDKRKGLVYLYTGEDQVLHFCWKDRTSGKVEDDLFIMPEECEFKKVSQCKTGRVFLLRFKANKRKFFFWMQEPKADKDDQYLTKVNELLQSPPGSMPGGESSPFMDAEQLHRLFGGLSQQQLMNFLGVGSFSESSRPSTTQSERLQRQTSSAQSTREAPDSQSSASTQRAAAQPKEQSKDQPPKDQPKAESKELSSSQSSAASQRVQLSDLQSALASIAPPAEGSRLDLSTVLTNENLRDIAKANETQLTQHLPEQLRNNPEELAATLSSPQFQQAVGTFSAAFGSGQLGPLISEFGLPDSAIAAATQGDMDAFTEALEHPNEDDKKDANTTDDEKNGKK